MAGANYGSGGVQFSQTYVPSGQNGPSEIVGSMPVPEPWVRSVLDGRRMMLNNTPESEFPNGYLGTITDRREDRIFDSLKSRINQRSYQRGVHLGERIDPGDYLWPDEQNPLRGIQAVAMGVRQAPSLEFFQPSATVDGKFAPRGANSLATLNPVRAGQLAMLRPKYGLPSRRQMSVQG